MEQLKIGDLVRIRTWEDLADQYGVIRVEGEYIIQTPSLPMLDGLMRKNCGAIGTIIELNQYDDTRGSARIKGSFFYYPIEALVKVYDDSVDSETWKSILDSI